MTGLCKLLLALLLACSSCLPAVAEDPSPPLPNFLPTTWEPDVPGGANEMQLRQLPCTANSLSLRLRIDETNLDPESKYVPQIAIRIGIGPFRNLSEPGPEAATLFIEPDPPTLQSLVGFLKRDAGKPSDVAALGLLRRGEEAALSISWSAGTVKASLNGGAAVATNLSRPPTLLLMTVSSVKATFRDIRVGFSENAGLAQCGAAPAAAATLPTASSQGQDSSCVRKFTRAEMTPALLACTRFIEAAQGSKRELAAAHANRAFMYLDTANIEAADKDATDALALDPDLAVAHIAAAAVLTRKGLAEKAITEADAAVKLDPQNDRAYNYRGMDEQILADRAARGVTPATRLPGRDAWAARAMSDFDQAIRLNPNAADYYYNRELALLRSGRFSEAARDADKLKALEPNDAYSWNSACWARAASGRELETALSDCDKAITLEPRNANYLESRCVVKFRMQKHEEADTDCTAALNIYPQLPGSLYIRGLAAVKSGHPEAGARDIAKALTMDQKIEETYARYGITREK